MKSHNSSEEVAQPDTAIMELIEGNIIDHRTLNMFVGAVLALLEHDFQELELATRD